MLLLEPREQATIFATLLYVPLGGSLPAAAGMLGPVLTFLIALLTGSLIIFRRILRSAFAYLMHHWRWTALTIACLGLVCGTFALWWL